MEIRETLKNLSEDPVITDILGLSLMLYGGLQCLGVLASLLRGKINVGALSQAALFTLSGAILYTIS